jgi:hypothetical protein
MNTTSRTIICEWIWMDSIVSPHCPIANYLFQLECVHTQPGGRQFRQMGIFADVDDGLVDGRLQEGTDRIRNHQGNLWGNANH